MSINEACYVLLAGDISEPTVNDLTFTSGTVPLESGSQMCLNFSIIDDQIIEPTERFTICGSSSQSSVEILNNGCADIKITDNEGSNVVSIANSF